MAKYNWNELEKEFFLSDFQVVTKFLESKGIPTNGNTNKRVSGWKEKKENYEKEKSTKIINKVTELEIKKEAKKVIKINDVANCLLEKLQKASEELDIHMDMFGNQHQGIIDRNDIKKLTSALKDLKEILPPAPEEDSDDSFYNALNGKIEEVWNDEEK